ncbi:protein what's this factor 1 like protein, partial [Quercus suber]
SQFWGISLVLQQNNNNVSLSNLRKTSFGPGPIRAVEIPCNLRYRGRISFSLKFKLTPKAERLYLEEMRIRNEMEDLLVVKLRKLLMMSLEKWILLEKISHLRTDIGLPLEFRNTICHRYLQYFRVVLTERGPALELTHWDPELAISAA